MEFIVRLKNKMQQKTKAKITKDMNIADISQKYPEAMMLLMEMGIHCVGCQAASFENLEMGLKGHGMDDKQIDELIAKLNEAVKKASLKKE